MAAARASADSRDRLVVELLARTGMRAGELADLDADAVVQIGAGHWLRIPLGKLRNDRMIPMLPDIVELFAEWTATNSEHIRATRRLLADSHAPIDRRTVHRIVARIDERNESSAKLARRLGMRQEALLVENEFLKGEWTNEVDFAMLAAEWPAHRTR